MGKGATYWANGHILALADGPHISTNRVRRHVHHGWWSTDTVRAGQTCRLASGGTSTQCQRLMTTSLELWWYSTIAHVHPSQAVIMFGQVSTLE
eukprot:4332338-Amphidinium_carterae.1